MESADISIDNRYVVSYYIFILLCLESSGFKYLRGNMYNIFKSGLCANYLPDIFTSSAVATKVISTEKLCNSR